MSIRVSPKLARDLISTGGHGCPFGDIWDPSGFLYASHKKTDEEILVGCTGESTGLYLMRGSKEYRKLKSGYPKYGYQYDVAEKFGIRLARWMKRTGKRVFATKFSCSKDKWTALNVHQCEKKVLDALSCGFFIEGEKLGITNWKERFVKDHSLFLGVTDCGVVAAYDPKRIMPRSLMSDYMYLVGLENKQ